jgi:hypothetical protein
LVTNIVEEECLNRVYVRSAPAIKLIFDDVEQPAMQAFDQCYGFEIQRLYLDNALLLRDMIGRFYNGLQHDAFLYLVI